MAEYIELDLLQENITGQIDGKVAIITGSIRKLRLDIAK
jgi:hypothetical protein